MLSAENFLTSTDDSVSTGTITIQNEVPLKLGANSENEIRIDSLAFQLNANRADQNVKINVLHNGQLLPSIFVNTTNQYVGIFTDTPSATLDVAGDVIVQGDLTVQGAVTTINTTNLEIADKLIELSKTDTPSNTTADGAGIRIVGGVDGDKDLAWDVTSESWLSTESINIASGKTYKINGFNALSSTHVYSTYAPNLESIGTLSSLQVDNININGNTISSSSGITLSPAGANTISVDTSRIVDVLTPVDDTDAANYGTVKKEVKQASLAISLTTTGLTPAQIASVYLYEIFPPAEYLPESPVCRVVCTDGTSVKIKKYQLDTDLEIWVDMNADTVIYI